MQFASAADVSTQLTRVASAPTLLVVSDFDGTLAGYSTDPGNVPVNHRSIEALQALAQLPGTVVAILSGRHREGLKAVSGEPEGIILAGNHGADGYELSAEEEATLEAIAQQLEEIVLRTPGSRLEYKPTHRVLHYRQVPEEARPALIDAAEAIDLHGANYLHGKSIIEFGVTTITKGTWLADARDKHGADSVVFLGDDVTDENAMRALGPNDLGIRVGEGESVANLRIEDTEAVAALLEELLQLRGAAIVDPA